MMNIRKSYAWGVACNNFTHGTFIWCGKFGCPVGANTATKIIEVGKPIPHTSDGKVFILNGIYGKCARAAQVVIAEMYKPLENKGWTVRMEV